MNIVIGILAMLFGALHAFAAVAHLRSVKGCANDLLMLAGSAATVIAAIMSFAARSTDWFIALAGLTMIVLAAILNGLQKEFHIRHHIVRIVIAAALFIGLLLT